MSKEFEIERALPKKMERLSTMPEYLKVKEFCQTNQIPLTERMNPLNTVS